MTRRWPAHDIAPYIKLIDDPSHTINDDGTYNLSEIQARAILDLRLQRLTALGVKEVTDELEELAGKIKDYLDILGSRDRIMAIISDELREVKALFAVPRRTEIIDWSGDMEDEDLIEREDMVVTITSGGYIKRTPLAEFRAQNRGGKGLASMQTKDDDVVTTLFVANTHTWLLFFTTDGMVYKLKTWRLPLAGRTAKGKALVNILPIETGISIAALMPVDVPEEDWANLQIVFATSDGDVRQNDLSRLHQRQAQRQDRDEPARRHHPGERRHRRRHRRHHAGHRSRAAPSASPPPRSASSNPAAPPASAASVWPTDDHVVSMSIIRHFEATPRNARPTSSSAA